MSGIHRLGHALKASKDSQKKRKKFYHSSKYTCIHVNLRFSKTGDLKYLKAVNKYFWKYKWRLLLGMLFVVLSNYFRILSPQVTGYVVNSVERELTAQSGKTVSHPPVSSKPEKEISRNQKADTANYDILVKKFIRKLDTTHQSFGGKVALSGITLLLLAVIGGIFMFLMRQTIIVMSRHIEFDQKNEIFRHYQLLDSAF